MQPGEVADKPRRVIVLYLYITFVVKPMPATGTQCFIGHHRPEHWDQRPPVHIDHHEIEAYAVLYAMVTGSATYDVSGPIFILDFVALFGFAITADQGKCRFGSNSTPTAETIVMFPSTTRAFALPLAWPWHGVAPKSGGPDRSARNGRAA